MKNDGKKSNKVDANDLSWPDYVLWLLIKSYKHSGPWIGMLIFTLLGWILFFILYALGYGDWVPEKYLRIKEYLF